MFTDKDLKPKREHRQFSWESIGLLKVWSRVRSSPGAPCCVLDSSCVLTVPVLGSGVMNRVTTMAALWRNLANRVEPAHVTGCFKMFNITRAHRVSPGRVSRTRVNQGDAVAIPAHLRTSGSPSGLYRDKSCIMKCSLVLGRQSPG